MSIVVQLKNMGHLATIFRHCQRHWLVIADGSVLNSHRFEYAQQFSGLLFGAGIWRLAGCTSDDGWCLLWDPTLLYSCWSEHTQTTRSQRGQNAIKYKERSLQRTLVQTWMVIKSFRKVILISSSLQSLHQVLSDTCPFSIQNRFSGSPSLDPFPRANCPTSAWCSGR